MFEGTPPSDVRITIVAGPAAHRFMRARVTRGIVGLVGLVVAGAVLAAVLAGSHEAPKRGAPTVAAAYGYPPGCLAISIARSDPSYARADFDHANACGRFSGYATAIFHRAGGGWRPALLELSYTCPVASLPRTVQAELGVCP